MRFVCSAAPSQCDTLSLLLFQIEFLFFCILLDSLLLLGFSSHFCTMKREKIFFFCFLPTDESKNSASRLHLNGNNFNLSYFHIENSHSILSIGILAVSQHNSQKKNISLFFPIVFCYASRCVVVSLRCFFFSSSYIAGFCFTHNILFYVSIP